jgi:hypothetical protein
MIMNRPIVHPTHNVWSPSVIILTGKPNNSEKNTTNPMQTDLGENLGLHGWRPA